MEEEERRDIYENSTRPSTCTSKPFNPYVQSQPATLTNLNETYNMQYVSSGQHSTGSQTATDLSSFSPWTQQ